MAHKEVWKTVPIDQYRETHDVSSLGRVRTVTRKNRPLSQSPSGSGVPKVTLNNSAGAKGVKVDQLVAYAFLGPQELDQVLYHINGEMSDCSRANLVYKPIVEALPGEEWLDVVGFEGHNMVSSFGRIISTSSSDFGGRDGVLLNPGKGANGYLTVALYGGGGRVTQSLHRLVAEAFLGPCPVGLEVCHEDGNRLNNRVDNLRYATHKENAQDMIAHDNHSRGSRHHRAKITESDVWGMLDRFKAGMSNASTARLFGMTRTNIGDIVNGKTWKHVYKEYHKNASQDKHRRKRVEKLTELFKRLPARRIASIIKKRQDRQSPPTSPPWA